ncbi:hypothetical protein LINGRAHAP2_LOCUS22970, partial [Linum grandiflorum]
EVFEVPHGLIQFVFPSEEEKVRIFQSQPWTFKSAIISLVPWELPTQDLFDRLQFQALTIQLKDLPSQYNNMAFGSKLVQPLGALVDAGLFSNASTSKQKAKYLKPVPYVFHTYVAAGDGVGSSSGPQGPASSGIIESGQSSHVVTEVPICSGMRSSSPFIAFHCYIDTDLDLFSICTSKTTSTSFESSPYPPALTIAKKHDVFLLTHSTMFNAFMCYVPMYFNKRSSACNKLADLQDMQLGDRKRHREEVLDSADGADSSTTPKRIRRAPPLTLADFPDNDMDLELLPDDLLDSDPDMIAVSAALSTSKVEGANHNGPPIPHDGPGVELSWDRLLPRQ